MSHFALGLGAIALALSSAACGVREAPPASPPRAAAPAPAPSPAPVPRHERTELRAALAGSVSISGAIHTDSVNAAFAQAAPAIGRCASDATARGIVVQTVAARVQIAHDGSLTAASAEPTPAADPAFAACAEAALRAQRFPEPLGPPMPGFEVPAGHDASEYMVASASGTYTLAAP